MGKKKLDINFKLDAPNLDVFPYLVLTDGVLPRIKVIKDGKYKKDGEVMPYPTWFYAQNLNSAKEIAEKMKTTNTLVFICKIEEIVEGIPFEDVISYAND